MQSSRISRVAARDIMKTKVIKVDPGSSLEDAVQLLADMRISGAPVIDRDEKLVGVLSTRDIARPENMRDDLVRARRPDYAMAEASPDDDESYDGEIAFSMDDYSSEVLRSGTVSEYMSTEPFTVKPDSSLKSICALMVKERIHRVIVVDGAKVVGIVTSLDIVRCVAEHG